jgi:hypothetical protein
MCRDCLSHNPDGTARRAGSGNIGVGEDLNHDRSIHP